MMHAADLKTPDSFSIYLNEGFVFVRWVVALWWFEVVFSEVWLFAVVFSELWWVMVVKVVYSVL